MTALYTIRDALSAFFRSPLRKWSSVFLLAVLALGGAYYYQIQSLGKVQAAYTIANSARFNDDDTARLNRTPGGAGNRDVWTYSVWIKPANIETGVEQHLFGASSNATNKVEFRLTTSGSLRLTEEVSGSIVTDYTSLARFRDPAKWHHVVVAYNSATPSFKIYVDNAELSLTASNAIDAGQDSFINAAVSHVIGCYSVTPTTLCYDGYMSDVYFVDGQALTPTSFGETDTNGYWRPKSYTGTYGTNGFKLDFASGSDLGNDVSGNNNDWTVNSMDATDQVTDTPTNDYATFNPLHTSSGDTLSQGSLRFANTGFGVGPTSIFVNSGKWYCEITITAVGTGAMVGLISSNFNTSNTTSFRYPGDTAAGAVAIGYWHVNGNKYINATATAYGSSYTTNDVIGIAVDADASTLTFYKNNASQGSISYTSGAYVTPAAGYADSSGASTQVLNCGQSANATSTATTYPYDSASGGYFQYTPPTGFKALSTNNLPTPTIAVPKQYFDAKIYTAPNLLLHFDNNLTDSTTAAHTITAFGGAAASATQSKYGGYSLSLTAASSQYIRTDASADFAPGTGSYTMDFWWYGNSTNGLYLTRGDSTYAPYMFYNSVFYASSDNASWDIADAKSLGGTIAAGTWIHFALVRDASTNTYYLFKNGVQTDSWTNSATPYDNSSYMQIGRVQAVTYANGYIDDFRFAKGFARWIGGTNGVTYFTPPTVSTPTVDTTAFQPSLVWIKDRTSAFNHALFDGARGVQNWLSSNLTNAEVASSTTLTAFNTNGFTVGTSTDVNKSGDNYISWLWKGGGAAVSNTSGSITSSVSANTTSGVSVVTYTGTGANATVGHGLSSAPEMIIVKDRTAASANNWAVYHAVNTAAPETDFLLLNSTVATADLNTYWNDTAPTASVFSVGTNADVNTTYAINGVHFDGTNDYLTRGAGLTGAADGKKGIFSAWFKFDAAADASSVRMFTSVTTNIAVEVARISSGAIRVVMRNSAESTILSMNSSATYNSADGWIHMLASWDLANSYAEMYINDVSDDGTPTIVNDTVDYTNSDWVIGAHRDLSGKTNGDMADFYFNTVSNLDLSVESNRRKFISASGRAVSLGSDGSTPTGTAPIIFLSGATAGWETNDGSGGGFTENGALSDASEDHDGAHDYVAYLFDKISGFSDFGSYTGNGSADGPFIYTGFKPRYVMVKRTNTTGDWTILDTARSTYNVASATSTANTALAEGTNTSLDFLANGFKLRSAQAAYNASAGTYIYAAFAEIPFKYSAASAASTFVQAVAFLMGMSF